MNFNTFFEELEKADVKLNLDNPSHEISIRLENKKKYFLDNEALFQLPLISLIVLLMAKDRSKPMVSEIGQMVGESIEDSMSGFKKSSQHVGWSANLRVRTVQAVSFLEYAQLIQIPNRKGRIKATELGKKVINSTLNKDDNLSYNLAMIRRSYRNIRVSKQLDMELR